MEERELVIVKPDGVRRQLVGEVISRLERKGLKIVALEMMQLDIPTAERLYAPHQGKEFFPPLIKFITSGPIVAMIVEGPDAIHLTRILMGATDSKNALPGTVRGDYSFSVRENIVHSSDSVESVRREVPVLFGNRVSV